MNFLRCTTAFLLFFAVASQAAPAAHKGVRGPVAEELIVKFRPEANDGDIAHAVQTGRLKGKRHLRTRRMEEAGENGLTLMQSDNPGQAIGLLKNHPAIEFVEPNHTYTHRATANDPGVTGGYLWGMAGGITKPTNIFGSQAAEAWAAGYTGTNSVFVGVIDEGVQITHPDLKANIWTNPFDPVDGLDNDGNGYADDANGWDFYNQHNVVFDPAGDEHGTHVAGTIGAVGGNGLGVAGVNWKVTMIPAKFMSGGWGDTFAAIEAIDYFVDLKARHKLNIVAINASWGGSGYSQALHNAILRAAKAGILVVAAAGNEGLNNDSAASYPANIDTRVGTSTQSAATYNAVLSVAAIDANGALADFSNYGAKRVHLGAPGVEIVSTVPTNLYASFNGTSMATPHVTGAIALYASTHPGESAASIRNAILNSVTITPSLTNRTATGGRLNLSAVIRPPAPPAPVATIPSAPSSLISTSGANRVVTIQWRDNSTNETGFRIYRGIGTNASALFATTGSNVVSFADSSSAGGVTYRYAVSAFNSAGESAQSAETVITTPVAPSAAFVQADGLTGGTWKGSYGKEGYCVIGDTFAYPANATIAPSGHSEWLWNWSTPDPAALERAGGTTRLAACWYSHSSMNLALGYPDNAAHRVSLYFLDWDNMGREQLVQIVDSGNGVVLDSRTVAQFTDGVYLTWDVKGQVFFRIVPIKGNAVLSGFFFDSALPTTPAPVFTAPSGTYTNTVTVGMTSSVPDARIYFTLDGSNPTTNSTLYQSAITFTNSVTVKARAVAAGRLDSPVATATYTIFKPGAPSQPAVVFNGVNTTVGGSWKGAFGAKGHLIPADSQSLPSFANISASGKSDWTWQYSTAELRALERATVASRLASCWYSPGTFSVNLDFNDSQPHRVSFYFLDWDWANRVQKIEVLDRATGALLDLRTLQDFGKGAYLTYTFNRSVTLRVTNTGPVNAVLSGIFFDN